MQLRYENRAAPATAALLFVALIVQCLGSMRLKSPTYDEPLYMASGFVALTQGVELTPEHAPLMKYLIAVPLILVGSSSAPSIPLWDQATTSPRTYSLAFLFNNRIDPDRLLFAGRTAVVFVSVLLATLVWVWSRQLYGPWPANVALGFYVFNPDIIAHSTLAMLDLGSTAGIAAASYAIWRAYKVPSATRAVAAGAVLAVALLMKSTGLLLLALLPLYLCAAIAHLEQHPSALTPAGDWNATMRSKRGSSWQPMSVTAIALFTAAVLVAVAYGPHRFGLVAYAESFRRGFLQRDTLMNREYEAFAWGRYSKTGFAWYFLAAFILKAPIPMLVGVVATIIWLACRGASKNFDEFFLALPVLAFFVTTTFVIDDIGIRYILPVYPMVFILIRWHDWRPVSLGVRGIGTA